MNNTDKYFASNTVMIFYSGTHIAYGDAVEMKNVSSFAMIGLGEFTESQYTSQSENITLWESSSIIKCQGNWSGITFASVRDIYIENLTFTGCNGLPYHYKGFLTFDSAWNVTLKNVTFRNNTGFGLYGDRMYGNTIISHCTFYNNTGNMYTPGGNSQFHYEYCDNNHSAHVNITHSYFLDGYSPYGGYSYFPWATGVAVIIKCPNVTFSISHVRMINNHADLGGNIAIMSFTYPGQAVTIENSHIMGGSAYSGGGLKIYLQLLLHGTGRPNIWVKNVHFTDNKGLDGGGALYLTAYQTKFIKTIAPIHIQNCTFTNNHAGSGAAVKIIKHQIPKYMKHTSLQYHMVFSNCSFSWNYPDVVNNMHIQAAIVDVYSVERIAFENCNFTDNNATALSLVSSNVCFYGKLRFERNRAVNGGALKFCQSSAMYISNHTQMVFFRNSAEFAGGAIYSEAQCSVSSSPCFFQLLVPNLTYRVYLEYMKSTLLFANNTASYAGDVIYGGAIDNCYTYTPVCTAYECSAYLSDSLFRSIFEFKDQPENLQISSNPLGVCFCDHDMSVNCSNKSYTLSHAVYPGQEFNVTAVVVGQMSGMRPGIVQSIITGEGDIITGEVTVLNNRSCHSITLAIGNIASQATISFQVKLSDPTTEAFYYQYKPPNVTVTLKPCPWGFTFTQDETGIASCQCDPILRQHGVKCYINNQTILRESPKWIGMFTTHTGNCQNTSGTDSTCTGVVVKAQCPYDYCRPEPVYLTESNLADQCANNRAGTLCGKCHEGYSVGTGDSHCRKCGNKYLFLIPLYLIAGILLVGFLMLFNMTVSTGTLHGLIFYANFVQFNRNIYFPPNHTPSYYTVASSFISWLNLETGLDVCFYDSMDVYAQSWLRFAFPIYIWVIAGLIILLSRRFSLVTRLIGRNAVKILATLIFLSYAQLLRVAIEIFQFTVIKQGENEIVVWLQDANVEYWAAKRIPLFVVSFLFTIASIVYAVVLTFITCLYRVSHKQVFFWVRKLKPFFDAYTGPYKVKYGFWPGVMFLLRILFFTAFALNVLGEPDLNMFLTAIMCLIVLLTTFFLGGVYQSRWVDILEAIFIFNLGVISIATMFTSNHSSTSGPQQAVIYTSIYASLVLFVLILCYHNNQRMSRGLHNMLNWLQAKLRMRQDENQLSPQDEHQPLLHQLPHDSDQYREGLLENKDN